MGSNLPNYKEIKVGKKDYLIEITLSRPEVLNALSVQLVRELLSEIKRIEKDRTVRFAVLRGDGDKAFCVGADLKERAAFDDRRVEAFLNKLNDIGKRIEDSRIIYFAAIDGYALGGGLEICLPCDFRFATERSILGAPEVRVGVIPGAGGTQRLCNICGEKNAKKIVLLGEKFDAKTAYEYGILHEVVKDRRALEKKVEEYVGKLSECAPLAISKAKKCINYAFTKIRKKALQFERENYRKLLSSQDRKEGLAAFSEKRKPEYKGR